MNILDPAHGWGKRSAAIAIAVAVAVGCKDAPSERAERLRQAQDDLAQQVEDGLADALPAPLSHEQRELFDIWTARERTADKMVARARAAMVPIAIAAAMFAIEGPADLLLGFAPVDKLGKGAVRLIRNGKDLRKRSKSSKRLVAYMDELEGTLDADDWQFLWVASRLPKSRRVALAQIYEHTQSGSLLRALVHKSAVSKDAVDLRWIASKLDSGALDAKTARRFEFDADFAERFTRYRANPSWRELKRVVEGRRVSANKRESLASKMTGLLGEQAAAAKIGTPAFAKKYLGRDNGAFAIDRGVGYGGSKSIDIAAYSDNNEAVFAEVKNWSVETWKDRKMQREALDQLARHNLGITKLLRDASVERELKAKLLIVREEPFRYQLDQRTRTTFEESVESLGWKMEYIPSDDIPTFGDVIDAMR